MGAEATLSLTFKTKAVRFAPCSGDSATATPPPHLPSPASVWFRPAWRAVGEASHMPGACSSSWVPPKQGGTLLMLAAWSR